MLPSAQPVPHLVRDVEPKMVKLKGAFGDTAAPGLCQGQETCFPFGSCLEVAPLPENMDPDMPLRVLQRKLE